MTTLYIDADACPVKDEAKRVAARHGWPVYVVSNGGIRPDSAPNVHTIIVSEGADVADDWIAERIGDGDICVTNDIPLAARCIDAGGVAIRPDGSILDPRNIGNILATRDLMTDLRAADPFRQGHAPAFTRKDRSRFLEALERLFRTK